MEQLNTRQALFVEQYVLCGNAAEAARLAGYSSDTSRQIGSRLLSNVDVKAALQARQQALRAELRVSKDQVVACILSAIKMGREQHNPTVMISGLVQIAKMLGFYEPEPVSMALSANGERMRATFAAMSDDELIAIAAGRVRPTFDLVAED
jgi:hypothetical protein